jgi:predicted phosphoribosyltransferase
MRFRDRKEAGCLLAERLAPDYRDKAGVFVLGLPRGGVPVADEVARALGAPLDVFIVRKLGAPFQEELAMGAIASGGVVVLNDMVVDSYGIPRSEIDEVAAREERELRRREETYRRGRAPLGVAGRIVILVDDGVATGSTMRAAVKALRAQKPRRLVVAVPVAPPSTCAALSEEADEVVCLETPSPFFGVGVWYADFAQTTDEEVVDILARHREPLAASEREDETWHNV